MKTKKITSWILFITMLVTMLPGSIVSAADSSTTPAPYPVIVTDVFSEMTNDISGVDKGTDLDLTGTTDESIPTVSSADGSETTLDGIDGTLYHNKDGEINYLRRKQILTFVAKSQDGSNFINSSTSTGVAENAVEIAYLDANREPLEIKVDSEEFEVVGSGDWSKAWIDLSQDVQQTDRTLETFLTKELEGINPNLLTAAQLFATGDMVSFMIYNVIRSDFTGYLRVKITDNNGNTTVQDYPIVADGQYPAVSISTSTYKNPVGANVENADVTTVAKDTFINEMDFVTVMENTQENQDANVTDNTHKSYRWHNLDRDGLQSALNWENEEYKPEDIWAMGDVTVDEIEISDLLVTSGIKSVKYAVANYGLKENVIPSTLEGTIELTYDPETKLCSADSPIVISGEGFNVLAITAIDNSGLKTTNRYYFYIDTTAPEAKFDFAELGKNVVSLFTVSDVVTNRQQAIDMSASGDIVARVAVVSGLEDATPGETDKNMMYQYRLLATKEGATEGGNVPDGYTSTVLDKEGNDLSGWKIWSGETETPVIDKEFDGIVQVRVQDRAGNWSPIVSATSDGKETVITDNTNPVIDVNEYALDTNGDTTGNTASEIMDGTATDILVKTARVTEIADGEYENEVIQTTTGDVAPWINDSAVLEVKITDEDLVNEIRSSGLNKGQINVKAEFNAENENKKIEIWNKNGVDKKKVDDSFNLTEDYIFGTETDKDLTFYVEYEGTGVVDITVSVKDQADVNDGDAFSSIYKTQLRVDKINPYIIYKGYDITDDAEKDLLKANNEKVDYEVRNMPWGPNSQVLEVVVKDDDVTPVQSKTKNVKFNADKALDLYKVSGDTFTKVKTYAAGNDNIVSLADCEDLANEKYESNVGYKFYLVYEGTGIAKVEFYADDSAVEPNVRNYPSVATVADAEPVLYDAMLRVDKIAPEIKNAKLVQTADDVNDGFMLFTVNETKTDVNTRKQMSIAFEITDENATDEQAGVNVQNEKIAGVDLVDVFGKYVETDKTHLYEDGETLYATDDVNDKEVDPNIDYILLPVEVGEVNGLGGTFTAPASASNADIEALVNEYIDKYAVEWKKASWKDGEIVVPDEFQGAIVLRTIDRVGNIDYAEPITFVAESRDALIDFAPQNGYIYSQNNYGWSKRDYDYVEIRVKDDNEGKVDAWLENAFISVTDLDGNDISTKDTVKFAHQIHANDASEEVDPSAYTYVSLSDFTNEAAYGYDVIDEDGLVEKLYRDEEGYIHLGYVRVEESAQIKVTLFDKAKDNDTEYTGNKTTGFWTSRIDRIAPTVNVEVVAIPASEHGFADNNKVVLGLKADIVDNESGVAPQITDAAYNVYTPENIPAVGAFATDKSYLYKVTNDADVEIERFDNGTFNTKQYELPGLQYALIPENGDLEDVKPWDFETNPDTIYDKNNGYNGKMGAVNVWHNYVDDKTPILPEEGFDGYIVVRAIDKAGNITVVGCAPTVDIEAAEGWQKDTQFIQVKASAKTGDITKVEYSGNNNLLTHDEVGNVAKRDISAEAASGEGAFIEVTEEGITDVIITASEEYTQKQTVKAVNGERNATWEGDMVIGNATATGYEDFKFQTVQVKIDKTAPTFEFALVDEDDNEIEAASHGFGIKVVDGDEITDPIPNLIFIQDLLNLQDVVGYRSHTPSGIAKVEYCVASNGMEEWVEVDKATWETGVIKAYEYNEAITGTVKVRVTDNAGNVTEKSKAINIDSATPIISISNDSTGKCSHDPVTVFVTVSERAEFSDIKNVTYEITDEEGNPLEAGKDYEGSGEDGVLALTGGTITVYREGKTKITVKARNKAKVSKEAETTVLIHYNDLDMPTIKGYTSGAWITEGKVNVDTTDSFRYSVNGSNWTTVDAEATEKTIELAAGTNTIRMQAFNKACLCESDVNTYVLNYDNGVAPNVSVFFDADDQHNWKKDFATVTISASQGGSAAAIADIEYELSCAKVSDGVDPVPQKYHMGPNGGNLVIQEEGQWFLENIIVTMESGKKYIMSSHKSETEADRKEFKELVPYVNPAGSEDYKCVVAKIDRTAPTVEPDAIELVEAGNDAKLFGLTEVSSKTLRLAINPAKAKDDLSGLISYEYAVLAKGETIPNWEIPEKLGNYNDEGKLTNVSELPEIIKKAFEGSVLLKVRDKAGNETIVSKSVLTEGIAPEISVTAPSNWQTKDFMVNVAVTDKGVSSTIKNVYYKLYKGELTPSEAKSNIMNEPLSTVNYLTSVGGAVEITTEGEYTLVILAEDYAGNAEVVSQVVRLDKTAPKYSGIMTLMGVYNEHEIPESDWNVIHDGWTYNHDVSLNGITDSYSGIKKVSIKFTSPDGATAETTLNSNQTSSSFSESGKYDLTLIDVAGNVRNISFAIDKSLENVINVVGVDAVGKLKIAVTDGDDMLTFFKKEDSESKYSKMYNGVTDQLIDGKTGVRYIYGQNDAEKKTNTLYVIVAPCAEYGVSLMSLSATPNRYLEINTEGENVMVTKTDEIFNPGINQEIPVGAVVKINEDGVYSITTND